jgi:hypothetical protein
MKKAILFLLTVFAFISFISAQAYEGSVEYNKQKQAAIIIEYSYSPEATEGAFLQKLENMGYRPKEEKGIFNKDKGFKVYKGIVVSDISDASMDYIINVERKSRKEKEESVLQLIILRNGTNIIGATDEEVTRSAKRFLNDLLPNVEAFNLELQIKAQQDVVVKAQKRLKSLQSDKEDMEKKIQKLQDDIKKNLKDQEDTQRDIENQNKALELLKGKRRSNT